MTSPAPIKNVTKANELMSGTDAVVQLLLTQRARDQAAGYHSAGFVSGYRGSPLGTLDMALWDAGKELAKQHIHFVPGVNEDLAATAVWGSQHISRRPGSFQGARYDGVFGLWYGKGPGVDRSGDVLKHANLAGSSPLGGALVLAGDDHAAKSSTTAHQSEQALIAAGIPVLYPADVRDIVHLGLHGFAMSRATGCWIALKVVTDVMESSMSVDPVGLGPVSSKPGDDRRAIRIQDPPRQAEQRLMQDKLPAVLAYARQHGLNRVVIDSPQARWGLVAGGKSYSDAREALNLLGLDARACEAIGLRLMKLDLVWPLDAGQITAFAKGLDSILVVEEKRAVVEDQLKSLLYDNACLNGGATRPVSVLGKRRVSAALGGESAELLPSWGELDPVSIAHVLGDWLGLDRSKVPYGPNKSASELVTPRAPSFCSGCPHSTSTRVPEGSRALAGIGCHGMATLRQPAVTTTMSHMGGEGAMWIGQAPFTDEPHIFANMGDGTYFHSGLLAIRAANAAKVSMTYKLLVNGFVSMTGGQSIDGDLSVASMIQGLMAEGVARIALVTDEPAKYEGEPLPGDVPVHHRSELDTVQRSLRGVSGVSVLIYEQPCATERRRLRKRGEALDPAVRTFIHPAVCEGCGDCGKASDCLSIEPLETPLGRKRRINQSSCNKDRTCVNGFCPSFITVRGGVYKGTRSTQALPGQDTTTTHNALPEPVLPALDAVCNVLFVGVGGTGVVTASAVLARAAQLQGHWVSSLDVTGLSQKYGGVQSHVRLSATADTLPSSRIAAGQAHVLIGGDPLVVAEQDVLQRLASSGARAALNTGVSPSADFTRNPDWQPDVALARQAVQQRCNEVVAADTTAIAERLLGDAIGANLMLLGMAWQRGWLAVTREAIEQAMVHLGGADFNRRAFELGRRIAHDPAWAAEATQSVRPIQFVKPPPRSLAQWLELHRVHLVAYQGPALAARFEARVQAIAVAEHQAGYHKEDLAIAVARGYYKLLAHKDEFEVARLLTEPRFRQQLQDQFEGKTALHVHLGGGALARVDPKTGQPIKRELSGWIWPALHVLAVLRRVRGTWLDPWRSGAERRLAQRWSAQYEADMDTMYDVLAQAPDAASHLALCRLARVPELLRGYGHVRERSEAAAIQERQRSLDMLAHPALTVSVA